MPIGQRKTQDSSKIKTTIPAKLKATKRPISRKALLLTATMGTVMLKIVPTSTIPGLNQIAALATTHGASKAISNLGTSNNHTNQAIIAREPTLLTSIATTNPWHRGEMQHALQSPAVAIKLLTVSTCHRDETRPIPQPLSSITKFPILSNNPFTSITAATTKLHSREEIKTADTGHLALRTPSMDISGRATRLDVAVACQDTTRNSVHTDITADPTIITSIPADMVLGLMISVLMDVPYVDIAASEGSSNTIHVGSSTARVATIRLQQ